MIGRNFRRVLGSFVAAALIATSAQAQFGGLFGAKKADTEETSDGCPKGKKRSVGSSILGGIVGGIAGGAASRVGITSWLPVSAFAGELTNAIACRLDPDEQKQAAEATLEATRSLDDESADAPPVDVGSTASWNSATREDVSGSSTVTARLAADNGADCITVTDVVIVKGEETRADKRMCRPPPPGSRRYSLVA